MSMPGEYRGVPPPAPSLNGGHYTGQPFEAGAPWGNVPIPPDAGLIAFGKHFPATAPNEARFMMPGGGIRPGNNSPILPSHVRQTRRDNLNATCVPDSISMFPPQAVGKCDGSAATRRTWVLR